MLNNLSNINNNSSIHLPNAFICPITRSIMEDPVMDEEGNSYERTAITRLIMGNQIISPITRKVMSTNLLPNRALRDAIDEHKKIEEVRQSGEVQGVIGAHTQHNAGTGTNFTSSYSYNIILSRLCDGLECEISEVGVRTGQTLAALAGIYTKQEAIVMEIDNVSSGIKINICFATVQDHLRFVQYYRTNFNGSIVNQGSYDQSSKKAGIVFAYKVFYEVIVPTLQEYYSEGFGKLISGLATKLKVPLHETVTGDVVERRLVAKAGIYKRQPKAMYRWNDDCSVRFHLQFSNHSEYDKFVTYYNTNYPRFILRGEGYKPDLSIVHVNTKVLIDVLAPVLQVDLEAQIPTLPHEQLIAQFSQELGCPQAQFASTISQILVALAGVYTKQDGVSCSRPINTNYTAFVLCFSALAEHQNFLQYYNTKYPGVIISQSSYDPSNKEATVIMDNDHVFSGCLRTIILEHKKSWFSKIMHNLATGLNVPYAEIDYGGDALEKRLVRQSGITTSQAQAQYRGNTDYSTRLHLAFAGSDEYQKFVDYYKQHYPQFVIRIEKYKTPLTTLHVSTKVLMEVVVPALGQMQNV